MRTLSAICLPALIATSVVSGLATIAAAQATAPATATDRAVRIIEEAPEKPKTPAAPTPATPTRPPSAATPTDAAANNTAGVAVDILPGAEVDMGAKLSFRVSAKRPGYLILVDVDSTGKLTQIFPNLLFMSTPAGSQENANLIRPGRAVTIPEAGAGGKNFEFVASPPAGVGMVVAILSDKPVQMIDLPDVPQALAGQQVAAEFVRDQARTLRILPSEETAAVTEPKWSFDTRFYAIR